MRLAEVGLGTQYVIVEDHFFLVQLEVLRVAGTQKLEAHLHQLFTCQLRPWEGL
jgi:hypothetical protein